MKKMIQKSAITLLALLLSARLFGQTNPVISYPAGPFVYTVNTPIIALPATNTGGSTAVNGQTSTLAGSGSPGNTDGTGVAASFNQPLGAVVDASGNVYICDDGNERIRKIT